MAWRNVTLTILNGATRSEPVNLGENGAMRYKDLLAFAPGTLPETITVYVAPVYNSDPAHASYVPLAVGGVNLTLPAGKATQIQALTCGGFVLVAGAGVGGDRVFTIRGAARQ